MIKNLKKTVVLMGLALGLLFISQSNAAAQILLNEVEIDTPNIFSEPCEYVEVRGTPGSLVAANTYFLSVDSDSGAAGGIDYVANISGVAFGSNGTITIVTFSDVCAGRVYPAGTTLVMSDSFAYGFGAESFILATVPGGTFEGDDIDANNDGVIDPALNITVIDGFTIVINPSFNRNYAPIIFNGVESGLDLPDAVTRFSNNNTALSAAAWYYGELAPPDNSTTYTDPRSANFPVGGALTPGAPNVPNTSAPQKAVIDFNGDGRTDYSVVRNQSEGLFWYTSINGTNEFRAVQFGSQNDIPVPEDYDGDGKDDIAVWRAGSLAFFYILNSSNNTFRSEQFGRTGDDPRIVGDWDGDNKADLAVYRNGAAAGEQSFFFYRPSTQAGVSFVPIQWGTNGDLPQRGDFDGDNRQDAAVFRPSNTIWYIRQSSNSQSRFEQWGLASDRRVPADYDGDGKTDLAIFREGLWAVLQSSNNLPRYQQFGQGSDLPVPGDYNGDGLTDFAVYRQGIFYAAPPGGGNPTILIFGQNTDFPVANVFTN